MPLHLRLRAMWQVQLGAIAPTSLSRTVEGMPPSMGLAELLGPAVPMQLGLAVAMPVGSIEAAELLAS